MAGTEAFTQTIKGYLDAEATKNAEFNKVYINPNKSLENCIKYILSCVQKSGMSGFDEEEIYSMARAYYFESKELTFGQSFDSIGVVVNHFVPPSQEEIDKQKQKALDDVFESEKRRLRETKKVKATETVQPTLF